MMQKRDISKPKRAVCGCEDDDYVLTRQRFHGGVLHLHDVRPIRRGCPAAPSVDAVMSEEVFLVSLNALLHPMTRLPFRLSIRSVPLRLRRPFSTGLFLSLMKGFLGQSRAISMLERG